MKTLCVLLFSLFAVLACAANVVQDISWLAFKDAGKLHSGDATAGQIKVENTESSPATLALIALEKPAVTKHVYALTGRIRYEGVEGEGYLEMWNVFPGDQRFFSRTMAKDGPMKGLHGSSDWRPLVVPFFNQEGGNQPVRLELNLFLPGKGVVFVSDLQLTQYETSENPLMAGGQSWWTERTSGLVFGILGSCIGVLGAVVGILTSLGKARSLVMALLNLFLVVGTASFAGGIVAFVQEQPYAVYYPLLLIGLLCTVIPLGLRRSIRKRFEDLELRKMRSMDTPTR
jgi:hypothetical protein